MDWMQMKEEYITGDVSYRRLGEKYGVAASTVSDRASREGWARMRREYRDRGAQMTNTLQSVADKLLRRIESSVDAEETLDVKDLRALVSAVKDLISIREACPELERRVRIAELEEALGDREGGIEVIFKAGQEEWNG